MFAIGSYLLLKGDRTYINFEVGMAPEWYPEYELPIGAPTHSAKTVAELRDPLSGLYRRAFTNGLVVVNPTAQMRTMTLQGSMQLATATGGGNVPTNGALPASWRIDYAPVQQITLAPGRAAVLIDDPSTGHAHTIEATSFTAGSEAVVTITGATPGRSQHVYFTRSGLEPTPIPALNVTLALRSPRRVAIRTADTTGTATWSIDVPPNYAGLPLWLQAAELGSTTNVLHRVVQ